MPTRTAIATLTGTAAAVVIRSRAKTPTPAHNVRRQRRCSKGETAVTTAARAAR